MPEGAGDILANLWGHLLPGGYDVIVVGSGYAGAITAGLGEGKPESLWIYYKLAEQTLDFSPHQNASNLKKVQALQKRASRVRTGRRNTPHRRQLSAGRSGGPSQGRERHHQAQVHLDCGDCVMGCNVGAKNTLCMNFLPLAKQSGAHNFTQTEVETIEKSASGGWTVRAIHRTDGVSADNVTLTARMVVLSAGALRSDKILLASRQQGLTTLDALGTRSRGNGDFFGLSYNFGMSTNPVSFGNHPDDSFAQLSPRSGPSIVGLVRCNATQPPGNRFVIADVSIARAYSDAAATAFRVIPGTDVGTRDADQAQQRADSDTFGADPHGALNSTMLYLCMAQDYSGGRPTLDDSGRLRIEWPGAASEPISQQINNEYRAHATAVGSTFIDNQLWRVSPWKTVPSAHPLGGCPMGEDGSDGVVDHLGRTDQRSLHPGGHQLCVRGDRRKVWTGTGPAVGVCWSVARSCGEKSIPARDPMLFAKFNLS